VTVWNVGFYAEDGEVGVVDHAYVSGAADAAYYVGECKRCGATISNVVARLSAVGYSGTNATGVVICDSLWDRNGAGILPNTFENEALSPQSRTTIVRNTVTGSGRARVPIRTPLAGFIGIGIAGGNTNTLSQNRVTRSTRVRDRGLPHGAVHRVRPGHPGARTAVAPARQPRHAEHGQRKRPGRPRAGARVGEG
jgi:hypothetical protein